MTAFIKNNLLSLIILLLFGIMLVLFFRGCFQPGQNLQPVVTIKRDTVYNTVQSAAPVQTQPIVIATQQPSQPQTNTIREIIYKNDTTAIRELLERFYSKTIYKDVLKIDTIGTVQVSDTISQNTITGRSYIYNLKYPVITNTVTIDHPYQPRNQLYVGGGIVGNQVDLVNAFKAGVLLKNKKDAVFEVNATISKSGIGGEIGFYKLISLRK